MPAISRVIARSGIFEMGGARVRITKESLQSIGTLTGDDRAIPIMLQHDPFSFPIGKVIDILVVPDGDEYVAIGKIYIEDSVSTMIHPQSSIELVFLEFRGATDLFVRGQYGTGNDNKDTVSVDFSNFDDPSDYDQLVHDIEEIDKDIACDNGIARHSIDPEPLIQFVVSNPSVQLALGYVAMAGVNYVRYKVDKAVREQADAAFAVVATTLKRIVTAHGKRQSKDSTSSVTQTVVPGYTEVVLLSRTLKSEEPSLMHLASIAEEINKYQDLLPEADSITLARSDDDTWHLQYIKTRNGQVIASTECYEATMNNLKDLKDYRSQDEETRSEDSSC